MIIELTVFSFPFSFSRVFIMFKYGAKFYSAELTLVVILRNSDRAIIISTGGWGLCQTTLHDTTYRPFNLVDGLRLSMSIY